MPHFVVDFSRVDSESKLARAVGCEERLVREVLDFNASVPEPAYDEEGWLTAGVPGLHGTFRVAKKNHRRTGEYRTVTEVRDRRLVAALKSLARRLDGYLREANIGYPAPACLGFVAGALTYKNAKRHLGACRLVTADIRDFFPSIGTARVEDALVLAGVPQAGADLIAQLTTVWGAAPPGLQHEPLALEPRVSTAGWALRIAGSKYGRRLFPIRR
ncbi:MAG: hypothetical protein OEZ06_00780 [Myxococcales bacterium]|nr:hypothetical protein [Myxococcales bacterium]